MHKSDIIKIAPYKSFILLSNFVVLGTNIVLNAVMLSIKCPAKPVAAYSIVGSHNKVIFLPPVHPNLAIFIIIDMDGINKSLNIKNAKKKYKILLDLYFFDKIFPIM